MGSGEVIANIIILTLIAWGIWAVVKKFSKASAIKAAAPTFKGEAPSEKGPMKVEVAFQEVPAKDSKHRLYGGDSWWRMHFDVRFSQEDWALFKKSGLIEKELFTYPMVNFEGNDAVQASFDGRQLQYMPNYRDYPDISSAEAAKESLIKSLHIIRGRIDDMKTSRGGIDRERLEI
jgi:hypothetical protein